MVILTRCCCFKSVKNGSFASAIYTLVLYIMILTAGTFHIHSVYDEYLLLVFTIIMVCLSALLVIASILLLIGLCGAIDPFKAILFVIDFVICVFNVYCFLCVISYYQQSSLIRAQCRYRPDKQYSSKAKNDLYNGKHNGCYNKDLKSKDNGQPMTTANTHNNHSDAKHYLQVKKDYRNELSVIAEENSGVFIEPHRKISSDASSGGRTDTSQLMSSHEEWSQSGVRSPIIEDLSIMNDLSDIQSRAQNDLNERICEQSNTVIIIDELL